MSDITCETLTRCFLWVLSIGEEHHCAVVERTKKGKTFINSKKLYGKF